uniref:Terminase small subunit n=1 Tax=Siphoviridae sp. ctcx61 TaxID=2825575 RepID=A0A8S5TWN1_9CAUD|nr:MAG TPA: Terminase small subunit [Siphoviridae sp. ctcx61]
MSLTIKQEIFVQRLIEGYSQREAYKFAYNCEKMKDESIDIEASKLFNNPKISLRYQELLDEYKEKAKWNRSKAEEKLMWLLDKSQEDIEYKGLKQANSSSMLNTIKELNTLTDLYPKKNKEDNNLEDREAEKIANAILELRGRNGTR